MRAVIDRHIVRVMVASIALLSALSLAQGASLKPEALKAWEEYIESASGSLLARANTPDGFLQIDSLPAMAAKVRRGQIAVAPAAPHVPKKVPFGLVHDWIGTVFIANATIKDVVAVVRDYRNYPEVYAPHVLAAKSVATSETTDLFAAVLMNKSVLSKTALDCDYETTFVRVDDRRMYSVTRATRIQEIRRQETEVDLCLHLRHRIHSAKNQQMRKKTRSISSRRSRLHSSSVMFSSQLK